MSIRNMTAKDARDNFTDLLGMVYYGNSQVVIEKKGRPFAVVVSPQDYQRYQQAAKKRFFEITEKIQLDNGEKKYAAVLKDITSAVEEIRQQKYGKGV